MKPLSFKMAFGTQLLLLAIVGAGCADTGGTGSGEAPVAPGGSTGPSGTGLSGGGAGPGVATDVPVTSSAPAEAPSSGVTALPTTPDAPAGPANGGNAAVSSNAGAGPVAGFGGTATSGGSAAVPSGTGGVSPGGAGGMSMSGGAGAPSGGGGGGSSPECSANSGETGVRLVSTFDLRGASGCPGMRLGDLDGDGRLDIVVGQPLPQSSLGSYTPQQVVAVTAFDLRGNQLWQHGTPNDSHIATSDVPIQVYDLDGDGKSEVFANMSDREMTVLDGVTGEVQRRIPLPAAGSNDSIAFANLRGTEWPQDIIVKTRYSQYWAITGLDSDLGPAGTVLWTLNKGPASGNADLGPGHYPLVYDWNGDGKDEVMGGYDFLDSDGNVQWSVTTLGLHADTIFTGDMDGDASDGYEIVVCGDYAAAFEWETGAPIWQNENTVEIQQGGMGDYRPDLPGLEVVLLDRLRTEALGLKSNNYLLDQHGNVLAQEDRPNDSGWLTVTENLHNWDGLGNDFVFSCRREEGVLLYDGNLETVATFPYDGPSPENFAMHADLCGDAREEVIVYDEFNVWIYANGGCDLDAPPCQPSLPQQYRHFNWSIYTGFINPDVTFFTPGSMQ